MNTTFILIAVIATVAIGAIPLLMSMFAHPALKHRKRMQKIVERIGSAQEFAEVMGKMGRMKPAAAQGAATVAMVKRVGLEQAGYPHRCEYCGSPLYINERECRGCGAPRK